jgi:DNA-binding HxlR family transcriptional regulator
MNQNALIIKHLKKTGHITQREAMLDYSIQSLTKRISELRQMGMNIKSVFMKHPITKQRYARYELVK